MAIGPGNYWFVEGAGGTQIGTVNMYPDGRWEWIPKHGNRNAGKWGTPLPGHTTYFISTNNVKVCIYGNAGDYDTSAPWHGGNMNGYGYLEPK